MILEKKQLWILWLGIAAFVAAFAWHGFFDGVRNLSRYKSIIESDLHQQERAVTAIMDDKAFLERQITQDLSQINADTVLLSKLQKLPFNIVVFKDEKPVFWTRRDILPLRNDLKEEALGRTFIHAVVVKSSHFELRYRLDTLSNGEKYAVAALLPIKLIYKPLIGKYLQDRFHASENIPTSLSLENENKKLKYKEKLITSEGRNLCGIALEDDRDRLHDYGMLVLLVLGFFFFGFFGDKLAKQMLIQHEEPFLGITFFVGTLVVLRGCVFLIGQNDLLPTLHLDDHAQEFTEAIFVRSLPSLIIDSIFMFWLAIFFSKEFSLPDFSSQSLFMRWTLAAAFYTVVASLNILNIGIFFDVVSHWKSILTFEAFSEFDLESLFALVSLGLLQISIFLISHRLVVLSNNLNLKFVQHFLAMDIAVGFGVMIYHFYGFGESLPEVVYCLFLLIYIALFRQFADTKAPRLWWLTQWILGFAFTQAFFVSQFSEQKEIKNLRQHAETLAVHHDRVAEGYINYIADTIQRDQMMMSWASILLRPSGRQNINERIKEHFESNDYLRGNYKLKYFGTKRNNEAVLFEDSADVSGFTSRFEKGDLFIDYPNQSRRVCVDKQGSVSFLVSVYLPFSDDNPILLNMEFSRSDNSNSRIFTDAAPATSYKGIHNLNAYGYAIYRPDGVLLERNRKDFFDNVYDVAKAPPPMTSSDIRNNGGIIEVTYRSSKGIIAHVTQYEPDASDWLTQAIFFVLIMAFLLLLMTVLHYFSPFLPEPLQMPQAFSFDTSFRNRVMFPVYSVFFISFALIFFFTYNYLDRLSNEFLNKDFTMKSNTVSRDFDREMKAWMKKEGKEMDEKELKTQLNRYSELYASEIHYYDTEGLLKATTDGNIFEQGFLARRMNSAALKRLSQTSEFAYNANENIGKLIYHTSYFAIRDTLRETLGYLEVPFYTRESYMRTRTTDVWSVLAPMLLLLFIMCSAIISIFTNRNIEPIQAVAQKIREWRLGDKQEVEPIVWDKKDEISELVSAFNTQSQELNDAAEKLKEGERELAWRDMARQVAHEIRNPLTPMKLTAQHVELMQDMGDDNAAEYALRSNKVLLEQIGNLEKIVNEFHNFARMPQKSNNTLFPLNDLVENVGYLFTQHPVGDKKVEVQMNLTAEQLVIYADRNLLTGALNNLVKNAIQAIPPERDGLIRISLYRENKTAIVKISDNGSGIPEDIQDKIFSPNFTTKSYGTGVGLLITKNIIQSVNGRISFDSVPNQGTDFFVELDVEDLPNTELADSNSSNDRLKIEKETPSVL